MTEHLDKMQTKVHVKPTKTSRDSVEDPTRNSVEGLVRDSNRGLTGGAQLQPQQDIHAIEVDIYEYKG